MKKFLRTIFINAIALAFTAYIFPGLTYGGELKALFLAAFVLTLINHFLKPIIKLFLLPINLVSMGMFRWLIGVICLFILTIIIPQIKVKSFYFQGFSFGEFVLPHFSFTPLLSLVFASFLLSLVSTFVIWLFKRR